MPIEFAKPHREDYKTEHDFMYAYGKALQEYNRKLMAHIDKEACRKGTVPNASAKRGTKTGIERDAYKLDSLHDFLADRPHLLARYKKYGLDGLL